MDSIDLFFFGSVVAELVWHMMLTSTIILVGNTNEELSLVQNSKGGLKQNQECDEMSFPTQEQEYENFKN